MERIASDAYGHDLRQFDVITFAMPPVVASKFPTPVSIVAAPVAKGILIKTTIEAGYLHHKVNGFPYAAFVDGNIVRQHGLRMVSHFDLLPYTDDKTMKMLSAHCKYHDPLRTEGDPCEALRDIPLGVPTVSPGPRSRKATQLNLLPNRHLTEDEQGTSAKFPEVKGDGAVVEDIAEAAWTQTVRPFDVDDADRLGIDTPALVVLNDFLNRVVNRLVQDTDESYGNLSPELDGEIARSKEMLQVSLEIQTGAAQLHTLPRYGYCGPWGAHNLGSFAQTNHPDHTLLQIDVESAPGFVENVAARAYVGRMVTPVAEAQAHCLGITEETAWNLSDFILHSAEAFLAAADNRLSDPNAATEEVMQRTVRQLNAGISVQDGALSIDSLAHYVYTDQEGNQHLWFTPGDLWNNRHLTDTEQGATASFPEVTGDGAAATDLARSFDLTSVVTAQQARYANPPLPAPSPEPPTAQSSDHQPRITSTTVPIASRVTPSTTPTPTPVAPQPTHSVASRDSDGAGFKRHHTEVDNIYPVGETCVHARCAHTHNGNDLAEPPNGSVQYHEPTSDLPPPTPRSLTKEEQQRSRSHREANKGSCGQAMPERNREEMRLDPQNVGQGTSEGNDKPKPIDYGGIVLYCRMIGCDRLATTRDQRCCYCCGGSAGCFPFPMEPPATYVYPAPGPHGGTCHVGMPGDDENGRGF
jgi:hypothetical protein